MTELFGGDSLLRLAVFLVALAAMMAWEHLLPRRPVTVSRWLRWSSNLGVSVLNRVALQFLPLAGVAMLARESGWGLLNLIALPPWLALVCSVLALDLVIYLQHRAFHRVPVFWRLHRMHHADVEFDVTTGVRFHPLEAFLSVAIKAVAVLLIGASVAAVLVFEVLLSTTSLFNHGNVRLPRGIDRYLRWVVVTPDMHRVHHSIKGDEMNTNFGFNVPWWDRLFGTYRDQPRAGHSAMEIGLDRFRTAADLRLDRMLWQPLR